MKAQIEVEKTYKITIGGVSRDGFKKVSEWEGMAKFQNKEGVLLVDTSVNPVDDLMAKIFNPISFDTKPVEVIVVKASPSFIQA